MASLYGATATTTTTTETTAAAGPSEVDSSIANNADSIDLLQRRYSKVGEQDESASTDASTSDAGVAGGSFWWWCGAGGGCAWTSLRDWAIKLSLYCNVFIAVVKLVAYVSTGSLSVLAALVDSVLDIVSQLVLNYTERHSTLQRSTALYPAGASRLEPLGVLICAALMGMASFVVLKQAIQTLVTRQGILHPTALGWSLWSMIGIVAIKLGLLILCQRADHRKWMGRRGGAGAGASQGGGKHAIQMTDPTLEALAQDHWNDALSNTVAAVALLVVYKNHHLWFVDPTGAILISLYIVHSWFVTGREQIEQLTGKVAPQEFLDELYEIASKFDERIVMVDVIRAYHFGPKFLVEVEVVLPKETFLFESHDLGMELQYEIEGREEVERCFVHMDYESRPYDEHVISKVPELREKYLPYKRNVASSHSV